ncbi:hypothetical protein E1A91_D01G035300v1 [Gossypium mustelinum]|uniref:Receptor-like serine/threonine-protein kinase n=1 Tax=Gossypium mustelinum TaxID=34275 RepID=A0A5D2W2C9_GOSMU|nr:hypothetical protein E1A91_D01G035300v1 [Gossypium mustelinum]
MGKTISCSVLLTLISCFYLLFATALDTITPSKSIKDPDVIISQNGVFRLGFFSLANSSNRYVGILYHQIPLQTVVWVANRNRPLKDSSGILTISDDGNLVVSNGKAEILWSTNLLDSGNLVLNNSENGGSSILWESFQHPSNVFLQTMKISTDVKTGRKVQTRSWKSPDDPSDGNFFQGIEPFSIPEGVIWNNNQIYFRTGPRNGRIYIGLINVNRIYFDGFYVVADDVEKTYYETYEYSTNSRLIYFELESDGRYVERIWDAGKGDWINGYSSYLTDCDVHGNGAFGICDSTKRPICSCLKGFKPRNIEEWSRGNWSSGCFRTTPLHCQRENNNGSEAGQGDDGFLKLKTEFKNKRRTQIKGKFHGKNIGESSNGVKLQQLPLFNFEELATATNNFHPQEKLGQGGFGPVYKGTLDDGKEIAVKRLSKASGQGLEEFMNEVVVISKLQHRNLVKLFGCCVEAEEKMLVYEFMPNKSLDSFLFDPVKQKLLYWRKRFNIIEGISRGLLYLHRDSRLKIIHRDLKASNVLLDQKLNPKISDFGIARIFGGDENQASTKRVVGTYGYMSPEYTMHGYGVLLLEIVGGRRNTSFYNKDDLSLLGYTNFLFYSRAWKLWREGDICGIVDKVILESETYSKNGNEKEIWRCIHLGLLCVQEFAKDRPTMPTIASMLNNEISDLNTPKQPAFTEAPLMSHDVEDRVLLDDVTLTNLDSR